ncbi:MAG: phage major capsid protein [Spirochaetes bacterium]|nr:phage major capsid protein [Spirochaetota bacterium]
MAKFEEISLEKEIYDAARKEGETLTQHLEKLDPSEEYKGSKLAKLDAFERQLRRQKLKVTGNACLVADFFKTSGSAVLFPEFVNRNVRLGMGRGKFEATPDELAATTTQIDSGVYKGVEFDLSNSDIDHVRTAEGAIFSKVIAKTKEKAINLHKIGRTIESSYEALRRVKANVLAVALQAIGTKLSRKIVSEMVGVIINGDGNTNPAADVGIASPNTLTYADMLELELEFDEGFEPSLMLADKATMKKVMSLTEFKDALIASEWLTNGKPQNIFGNALRINAYVGADIILAIDPRSAIEMLEEKGGSLVETEKLIDKQFERVVISKVVGFNKLFTGASRYLDISP